MSWRCFGGTEFIVLRTDNGGATWLRQPSQGGLGDANEVSAVDAVTVYVAVDNFVQWNTSAGQTSAKQTMPYYTMDISTADCYTAMAAVCGHGGQSRLRAS